MRFMMLMIPRGYETAAPGTAPPADAVAAMMKYNEALKEAGVLVTLDGLHPPSMGARVSFAGTLRFAAISLEAATAPTARILETPPEERVRMVDELGWSAPTAWADVLMDMDANAAGRDMDVARRLFDVSEELTGVTFGLASVAA